MTTAHPRTKDFPTSTRRALKAANCQVVNTTWIPGADGSYANGEVGYLVNHGGTGRMLTYLEILRLFA